MAKTYCVVTGRVLERRAEPFGRSPHYQILVQAGGHRFRIAVNTRSGSSHGRAAHLLYFADDDFRHEITGRLAGLADGVVAPPARPGGLALDYQRGGMVTREQMHRLPDALPGPRNDLVDEIDYRIDRAMADPGARLHAFGARWGPEPRLPDQVFGFTPGNGVHDVHMNQGNRDEHMGDNAVWHDGGLIFHEPRRDRWCAVFLAFQPQAWHTDEHGDALPTPTSEHARIEAPSERNGIPARIVAAFVHPNERKLGVEHVTIRNDTDAPLDLRGWRLRNGHGEAFALGGIIPPRQAREFPLPTSVPLSARGGTIALLDESGFEIDRVAYTRRQAARHHGRITF